MSTPDFILQLRQHIGHAPLWVPGCTAVILRAKDPQKRAHFEVTVNQRIDPSSVEVLCVRRSDNGQWTPVTGIVDPGEEPAQAAVREAKEECAIRCRMVRLLSSEVVGPMRYDNGDEVTYLDTAFLGQWIEGEPRPADGENLETVFYAADALPPMNARFERLIAYALSGIPEARFMS